MISLGGQVLSSENAKEFSSAIKGETIEDTARVVGGMCDVLIIRHPETGATVRASSVSPVPVINAGDGDGEHPTQSLIDLYTILQERGTLEGLTVTMFGDLRYGRTVHSLARLLRLYWARMCFVSPQRLAFPRNLLAELHGSRADVVETTKLSDVLTDTDVLYVTRVQKERFSDLEEYAQVRGSYQIDATTLAQAKSDLVVMHPLPRVDEIAPTVDALPNAAYFRQAHNGVPIRMALLHRLFVRDPDTHSS